MQRAQISSGRLSRTAAIDSSYQGFDVQLRSTKVFHSICTKQKLSETILKVKLLSTVKVGKQGH